MGVAFDFVDADYRANQTKLPKKPKEIPLDIGKIPCYNKQALQVQNQYRGVEQLEARRAHNPEVVGSSPASATIRKDLLSYGSESFFALLQHSCLVRSIRF